MKLVTKFLFFIVIILAIIFMIVGVISPFYIESRFLSSNERFISNPLSSINITNTEEINNSEKNDDQSSYSTHQELGPIGDWLSGSSTPLFTLASFLILVAALMAQMAELRATREEFSQQNKEFHEQNQLLSIQRFENTFFQMVSLHHQIVNSIEDIEEIRDYGGGLYDKSSNAVSAVIIRGRQVLNNWCYEYGISNYNMNLAKNDLMNKFDHLYNKKESVLGHYYRNLFHIVDFIDSSAELMIYDDSRKLDIQKTAEQRRKYIRILRAQLSTTELILLLYNSLTDHGKPFYKLIVKYRLLNNLRKEIIPNNLHPVFDEMKQY